jgi:hypothetical protein
MHRPLLLRIPFLTGRILGSVLGVIAVAACGGNLTAGGLSEAEVVVSGDAPEALPVARQGWSGPLNQTDDDDDDDDDADDAEGELEADFFIYLESGTGERVTLTDEPVRVQVDLEGTREQQASLRSIPSGAYAAMRLVFINVDVEVDAGLTVGGQLITGEIDVELEADSAVVTRPLSLQLDDGDRVEILVDLNAKNWLLNVDPALLLVPEEFFADAIEIRVR